MLPAQALLRAAQTLGSQAEVAAHGRGQGALAGEAALFGNPNQRQAAFAQQPRGAVEASFQQVLVRRQANMVLELRMEMAGAKAGDLGSSATLIRRARCSMM